MEEIEGVPTTSAAAPECTGSLGWVYYNGFCYMFTSYHVNYLTAEELCNQEGAYLADVMDQAENDFIEGVLNVVNPKDGTDYWLGGLDADRNKGLQWMTGKFSGQLFQSLKMLSIKGQCRKVFYYLCCSIDRFTNDLFQLCRR